MSASQPPNTGGSSTPSPANGSAKAGHSQGAATADLASAGAFAKRFPRLQANMQKYASSRAGKATAMAWKYKRRVFIGLGISYGIINYLAQRRNIIGRDTVRPDTWLFVKVHPGSIVDAKSTGVNIQAVLSNSNSSSGEEKPSVMELFDVIKALKWAGRDESIKGLYADFSGLHIPSSVTPNRLGMAQLEELVEAVHDFKLMKREQHMAKHLSQSSTSAVTTSSTDSTLSTDLEEAELLAYIEQEIAGNSPSQLPAIQETDVAIPKKVQEKITDVIKEIPPAPITTIAWADSFDSQGSYLLASAFDQVYLQPSGEVPLTGVMMQTPFFKKALDWLGVRVYAEARKDFKSMISAFTQEEGLPPAQLEDEAKLLGELSRSMSYAIGVNRFADLDPEEAADKVSELSKSGPFSAKDALEQGLITGIKYKSEVKKELGERSTLRTLASYHRIMNQAVQATLHEDTKCNIAVVYLQGTISNAPGEFSASSVIKGLKEAGEDDNIAAIVLRIDSGGGDVVASDSIWDAVRRVREDHKKPVVASFGNVSASGGYYASTGADAILACESTITGSIGVASLRPTFTKKVFDRFGVALQTVFTGSKMNSSLHDLTPEEKARQSRHIDEVYDTFLDKVCQGRDISRDVVEDLAGGKVWTGLAAWIRCHPGKESFEIGNGRPGEGNKIEEAKRLNTKEAKTTSRTVKLITNWKTTDVSQENEMSTFRIYAGPASGPSEHQLDAVKVNDSEDTLEKEIIVDHDADESKEQEVRGQAVVARSVIESGDNDEEAHLAAEAHKAAKASHSEKVVHEEASESTVVGPYGKGLIDLIGGIWDAGIIATNLSCRLEIDKLIASGMTIEQAIKAIRPNAVRQVNPDNNNNKLVNLELELNMIKYPREKTFWERFNELNKTGDQPSLSLLPGFGNLGLQMREYFTDLAVDILIKCWRDPATIQRIMNQVDKGQNIKMDYQSNLRM